MVHTKTFLSEWKDEAGFPWGMSEADLDVPMPSASWWVQSRVQEVDGVWSCDLDDCDAVTVNAMRRWLLTDVPVVCFRTETEAVNGCRIEVNTSRLHNEMLKHRLSCVPVHLLPEAGLHDTIEVVLDNLGRHRSTVWRCKQYSVVFCTFFGSPWLRHTLARYAGH